MQHSLKSSSNQLAKYQLLVKRNGLNDNEAFSINDEKVRPDGLIDFFYNALHSRDERRKELIFNSNVLDICNSCLDLGMPMHKIASFIISGDDIGILKRKLTQSLKNVQNTGVDLTMTERVIDGCAIPLNMSIDMIENRLLGCSKSRI